MSLNKTKSQMQQQNWSKILIKSELIWRSQKNNQLF